MESLVKVVRWTLIAAVAFVVCWLVFAAVVLAWVSMANRPDWDKRLMDHRGEGKSICLSDVGDSPAAHRYCDCFLEKLEPHDAPYGATLEHVDAVGKGVLSVGPGEWPFVGHVPPAEYRECLEGWHESEYPLFSRQSLVSTCVPEFAETESSGEVCDCFVKELEAKYTLYELSREMWKWEEDPSTSSPLAPAMEGCAKLWKEPQCFVYFNADFVDVCSQAAPPTLCRCIREELEARPGVVVVPQVPDCEAPPPMSGWNGAAIDTMEEFTAMPLPEPLEEAVSACVRRMR